MRRDNTHDEEEAPNPWTHRGFIASAVVVALIAVLGLFLAFAGPSGGNSNAAPPATTPAASTSPSPGGSTRPASDSACGLPAGEESVPRTAPKETKWELVGTMAAPTAPDTYGPGRINDGLRSCYAHSPTGALYAAVNIAAMTGVPELREPVVRQLAAAGPERDRALQQLKTASDAETTGGSTQVAGFTFLSYDDRSAAVDLAVRAAAANNGQSGYVHIPMTLRWDGGDWKVVLAPDGSLGAGIGAIPDLTGYVPWGGA